MLSETARRALEAYGGEARWREATSIEAVVSAGGLAFALKWQRPFRTMPVTLDVHQPRVRIHPPHWKGVRGVLEARDVRLEGPDGTVLSRRDDAGRFFPYGRRLFWWDRLDQAYFSGYALWNYLCLPALLLREDIEWREVRAHLLEARFPAHLPTHSPVQVYHFDPATGLLLRHDYTALVFGSWARASNVVLSHERWEGVPFPGRRRVTPRFLGRPMPFPLLVGIRFHECRLL